MAIKGYRKYSLVVGIVIVSIGLLLFSKLTGDQFVTLVSWVTGLYLGANSAQAVGEKVAMKPPTVSQ
jgi:hypothetical protein